jgi:2-hydroxycyclohexanecarboxyl-CoA dehydrogenase
LTFATTDREWAARGSRGLALVTGGSGTLGQAICRALFDDGWGLAVGYVNRRRATAFVESLPDGKGRAAAVPLDLLDRAGVKACAERLLAANGAIDVVVFNGGVSSAAPFHQSAEENWRSDVAVNFLGTVLLTEACLPAMVAAGRGRLVGITSEAAKTGDAKHASYSAAKAAQASYLTAVAQRVAGTGVTANSIAPGPVESPLLEGTFASAADAERALAAMLKAIPAGRLGAPGDIAEAVRFLVTSGASVSGVHLSVGGGITMQ